MSIPEGVRKFDGSGEQASTKGKYTPAGVSPGRSANTKGSGSHPAIELQNGSANKIPAAVRKHSGTEDFGAQVKHLNAKHSGPSKAAGANAIPEGVRKFKGTGI